MAKTVQPKMGVIFKSYEPLSAIRAYAQQTEASGLSGGFWIAEAYHWFRQYGLEGRGCFTTLVVVAEATSKIPVELGITSLYMRHPTIQTSEVAAIDELSNGRFVIGIGVGKVGIKYLEYDLSELTTWQAPPEWQAHNWGDFHFEHPTGFLEASSSVVAAGASVAIPHFTKQLDYEIEIGVMIGKKAFRFSPQDALNYVASLTIFNDLSARDIQARRRCGSGHSTLGAVAGLPLGILVSLTHARPIILGALVLAGTASLAGAFASTGALLITTRALEGWGFIACAIAAPRVLRTFAVPRERETVFAMWGIYLPSGAAAMMLGGPYLLSAGRHYGSLMA